jgi:hypothetical protein
VVGQKTEWQSQLAWVQWCRVGRKAAVLVHPSPAIQPIASYRRHWIASNFLTVCPSKCVVRGTAPGEDLVAVTFWLIGSVTRTPQGLAWIQYRWKKEWQRKPKYYVPCAALPITRHNDCLESELGHSPKLWHVLTSWFCLYIASSRKISLYFEAHFCKD